MQLFACAQGTIAAASRPDPGAQIPPGSFEELLDLQSLPAGKSWRTYQASGYDRGGGFYDSGNLLRIEDDNRYVLMEANGPGCIDRMWFTYKKPMGEEPYDLLIYVDDRDAPVIDIDLDALFAGGRPPFVSPLSGACGLPKQPGRFSYVPIGFARYCKVVLRPSAPKDRYNYRANSAGESIPHVYYQITYRQLAPRTAVRPFTWRMDADEQNAFERVKALLQTRGVSPWTHLQDVRRVSGSADLNAGKRIDLFREEGEGVIHGIRMRLNEPRGIRLEMSWDGAGEPRVAVPLGPFFACDADVVPKTDVRGLWTGYEGGWYYCYLPMPFRRQARMSLLSPASQSQKIDYEILYRPEHVTEDQGSFCAHRYDHNPPSPGRPYEVLDVKGSGHFVGIIMDRPGHMEGDDRFFVDGEASPSIHGTGTEDFFNFAWGLSHTGSLPLHGITIQNGHPIAYRFHVPASVPFTKSLRITWEHGHDPERGPNLDQGRYSGIAMYYLLSGTCEP
jgi:hypothetical protein